MTPVEFKQMMMRTFNTPMNSKELGALTQFFKSSVVTKATSDSDDEKEVVEKKPIPEVSRINTQDFLIYFNKIQVYYYKNII